MLPKLMLFTATKSSAEKATSGGKLRYHRFGTTMEVVSIADFERDQLRYQDRVMDSAIDQLEALSQPGRPKDVVVQFGDLKLSDSPRLFEFDAPTTCPKWPGLRFGPSCIHRQVPRTTSKAKKSSEKKHGRLEDVKHSGVRARRTPAVQKKPKSRRAQHHTDPTISAPLTPRDPPLNLMTLPAEVRNQIWTILSVQPDPIEAQLRLIQPGKVLKGKTIVTRRYPQEPVIVGVNHQLRKEVLSLFYSLNKFVFEKSSSSPILKNLSMTNPNMLRVWMPSADVSKFLTHIDLRLECTTPAPGGSLMIVFRLTRMPDCDATITVHTSRPTKKGMRLSPTSTYCLCRERNLARTFLAISQKRDLAQVAEGLLRMRLTDRFVTTPLSTAKHYPPRTKCDECGNDNFEVVYSGY